MEIPLEIRFHHVEPSDAAERLIRAHVDKLARLYDRLIGVRVAVELQHHQHRTGNMCDVHIEMSVPGQDLVVSREPHDANTKYARPDLETSLRDAFKAAERQLKDFKQREREDSAKTA
jgi:ribosome-associated translation inhibitor RaiA